MMVRIRPEMGETQQQSQSNEQWRTKNQFELNGRW